MKTCRFLLGAVLMVGTASAFAHAHLHNSTPADGSVVASSPPVATLTFSEAALVTAAWLQKGDGPKESLGSLPQKSAPKVSIPLPALAGGSYSLSWRVVSEDGHVMGGEIHFTVTPGAGKAQQTR